MVSKIKPPIFGLHSDMEYTTKHGRWVGKAGPSFLAVETTTQLGVFRNVMFKERHLQRESKAQRGCKGGPKLGPFLLPRRQDPMPYPVPHFLADAAPDPVADRDTPETSGKRALAQRTCIHQTREMAKKTRMLWASEAQIGEFQDCSLSLLDVGRGATK